MIIGIGTDIIETIRVGEKIGRTEGFREKVFSKNEIEYCESKKNKFQHYAGRFAAKEALLKAFGIGLLEGFSLFEIEINNDEKGVPYFSLSGRFAQIYRERKVNKVHLSISHLESVACAMVILEHV